MFWGKFTVKDRQLRWFNRFLHLQFSMEPERLLGKTCIRSYFTSFSNIFTIIFYHIIFYRLVLMHIEQLMYEQHFVFKNIKNNDSNQTIRKVYIRLWIYWLHKQFVSENRKIFRFTCKTRETKRKYNERKKDCLCVLKWYSQTSKPKPFFHRINWWSEMIALNVLVLWIYWFFCCFQRTLCLHFYSKSFLFCWFSG